jgi:putative nucleotidyltransferase with HDIG domain
VHATIAVGNDRSVFEPILSHVDVEVLAGAISRINGVRTRSYSLLDHSYAVSFTAYRLATAMGLSGAERAAVSMGGLLHDTGKSLTRFETLFKAGPLTASERSHVCQHPSDGAMLIGPIGYGLVVDAVMYHHEFYDGTGYPRGLRGEAIPLAARIVGVADYYEALLEDRAYRPGIDRLAALETIERAGDELRLDPAITRLIRHVTK